MISRLLLFCSFRCAGQLLDDSVVCFHARGGFLCFSLPFLCPSARDERK